jgi:hypothetical protein
VTTDDAARNSDVLRDPWGSTFEGYAIIVGIAMEFHAASATMASWEERYTVSISGATPDRYGISTEVRAIISGATFNAMPAGTVIRDARMESCAAIQGIPYPLFSFGRGPCGTISGRVPNGAKCP